MVVEEEWEEALRIRSPWELAFSRTVEETEEVVERSRQALQRAKDAREQFGKSGEVAGGVLPPSSGTPSGEGRTKPIAKVPSNEKTWSAKLLSERNANE